jgi:hypothetical protein
VGCQKKMWARFFSAAAEKKPGFPGVPPRARPLTYAYAKGFLGPLARKHCHHRHAFACVCRGMRVAASRPYNPSRGPGRILRPDTTDHADKRRQRKKSLTAQPSPSRCSLPVRVRPSRQCGRWFRQCVQLTSLGRCGGAVPGAFLAKIFIIRISLSVFRYQLSMFKNIDYFKFIQDYLPILHIF